MIWIFIWNRKQIETVPKCADSSVRSIVFIIFRFERCSCFLDSFSNELIANASRWMLIENGIHQCDFSRTSSGFGFRWTILNGKCHRNEGETKYLYNAILGENKAILGKIDGIFQCNQATSLEISYLKTTKTATSWQGDVTNVRLTVRWNWFIDYNGTVFQISATCLFHLPKFLERFHDVNCEKYCNDK